MQAPKKSGLVQPELEDPEKKWIDGFGFSDGCTRDFSVGGNIKTGKRNSRKGIFFLTAG